MKRKLIVDLGEAVQRNVAEIKGEVKCKRPGAASITLSSVRSGPWEECGKNTGMTGKEVCSFSQRRVWVIKQDTT